jgi:hypothetical protein
MGEMADYELDAMCEPFHDMDGNEYDCFDNVYCPEGEDGPAYRAPNSYQKTCRCCGAGGLHWGNVGGKWLLHDSNGVHKCPVNECKPKQKGERKC